MKHVEHRTISLYEVRNFADRPIEAVRRGSFMSGLLFICIMLLTNPAAAQTVYPNPASVDLLTAGNFRILAGSTITIGATTTVTGDVGVSPGATVTNSGSVSGSIHLNDAGAIQAQSDLITAFGDAAGRSTDEVVATELGGTTLGRGVYASASGTFGITGNLTLTGTATDIFIFKMATTLTTGAVSSVTLSGGAVASNVFWQVGSSATIDGNFNGVILAYTSITQNVGASIDGRALAQNGFVTVNGTNVLPVQVTEFTAIANRMHAELAWTTATEVDNDGFDVERRVVRSQSSVVSSQSSDANRRNEASGWAKIAFIQGAGTSTSLRSYGYTDNDLAPGRYAYRIKQVDRDGGFSYHGAVEVEIGLAAKAFALDANYPNPFNPSTSIVFTVGDDGHASLIVYNVLGQQVVTLFDGIAQAGRLYEMRFDATHLTSGLYFAKLESGRQQMMRKMVLMK